MPDFSPLAWALILASTYITGISKGGFAGGFGSLSVPLMALAIGPLQAAGLLLPLLIVMDLLSLRAWWGQHDAGEVKRLVPAAAVGIVIGTLTVGSLDENKVRLMLGVISLAFAAYMLFKPTVHRRPGRLWAAVCGGAAGFTSTLAHAGGPPMNLYLLPRQLPKATFIATSVVAFAFINALKIGPFIWLGELTLHSLGTSALLIPVAWFGVRSGIWLQARVNEKAFFRLIIVCMALISVQLIWRGLHG
ncbi:sulfite exporter TauE/SafE family protein [Alloalcanivorax marinus]|uniref:sulfite exporter TauE/SafE family protein n=1 Tax=Alloalcanivorax marinus TaxID=1177169 RepID=UPI00195E3566|nr:sulfite exporter TauE/SafE family protein [Alloalcanivorax marinus]MBM7335164.1 sulfite exporter TauE/SafE family protein [Alloalcanivorax marinus]